MRTVAEGKNAELFDSELTELVERFETAFKHLRDIEPPKLILGEIDRTSVILRDILNPSFENIYVNDLALSKEIKRNIGYNLEMYGVVIKHLILNLILYKQ